MTGELKVLEEAVIKLRGFGGKPDPKNKNFIKKVYSWGEPTFNHNEVMIDDVILILEEWMGKVLLKNIISMDMKQGNGSRLMKRIIDLADDMDVTIELYPQPIGVDGPRIPLRKLKKWYRKFGFDDGDRDEMIRYPN